MPLPVVPLVAGGALAALLFAGKKEKDSSSTVSGPSATPTQASTGGANGGATVPSHADVTASAAPQPCSGPDCGGDTGKSAAGTAGSETAPIAMEPMFLGPHLPQDGIAPVVMADPWAPSAGPSVVGPLKPTALTDTTKKVAAESFAVVGTFLGQIW
jgi:hypothetical protein